MMDEDKKKALEDLIGDAYDKKTAPKIEVEDEAEESDDKCKCGCGLVCEDCKKPASECDC